MLFCMHWVHCYSPNTFFLLARREARCGAALRRCVAVLSFWQPGLFGPHFSADVLHGNAGCAKVRWARFVVHCVPHSAHLVRIACDLSRVSPSSPACACVSSATEEHASLLSHVCSSTGSAMWSCTCARCLSGSMAGRATFLGLTLLCWHRHAARPQSARPCPTMRTSTRRF